MSETTDRLRDGTAGGAVLRLAGPTARTSSPASMDFAGILQADAYGGYNELPAFQLAGADYVGAVLGARKAAVL